MRTEYIILVSATDKAAGAGEILMPIARLARLKRGTAKRPRGKQELLGERSAMGGRWQLPHASGPRSQAAVCLFEPDLDRHRSVQ